MDQSSNRGTASENPGAPSNSCPGVRRLRVDQQLWDLVSQPRTVCPSFLWRSRSKSQAKLHVRQILSRGPAQKRPLRQKKTMSELRCADDECDSKTEAYAKLQDKTRTKWALPVCFGNTTDHCLPHSLRLRRTHTHTFL